MWDLFERAARLPAHERAAWLDRHCADPSLRRELDQLLQAHDLEDSPLDRDPVGIAAGRGFAAGERIGPWRVLRELGRGGMGEVYLVERADGAFERRAALKLMHPGLAGAGHGERFQRERRILASLSHPNIARLLDAGVTEGGQPWLLMEAVDGMAITDWCREQRVSIEGRLQLFEQVCAAVSHAHRRLIVHRDLKPSNIRVTTDGRPVLLDFGIAKLLDAAAGADVTRRPDAVPLSPGYASPEQIRGEDAQVGMDVFALGALLYELLANKPPFPRTDGSRDDWLALRRGLRISISRAADHATDTPVELDWIMARAMAFEPDDRYLSVDDLAADVKRVRQHRAPRARAVGLLYRGRKFLRRHWRPLGATGIVIALILGLATSLYFEAERANRAVLESETAQAQSEQISMFMMQLFELADSTRQQGRELTARDILAAGRNRLSNQPDLPAENRVNFQLALADIYLNLGDHEAARSLSLQSNQMARSMNRKADQVRSLLRLARANQMAGRYRDAREALWRANGIEADLPPALRFDLLLADGIVGQRLGDLETAGRQFDQAARLLADELPDDPSRRAEVALRLGAWHWSSGRIDRAETFYARALAARQAQVPVPWPQVATAFMAHGSALYAQGEFDQARAEFEQALGIRRRVLGEDHAQTAISLDYVGTALYELGRHEQAEPLLQQAVEIQQKALPADSPARTGALNNLGLVQRALGKHAAAADNFHAALAINRGALGERHPDVANNLNNLGLIKIEQHQWRPALARFEQAAGIVRDARGESHPDLGTPLTNQARMLIVLQRYDDARRLLEQAYELLTEVDPDHTRQIETLQWWGLADCLTSRPEDGLIRLAEARDISQRKLEGDLQTLTELDAAAAACAGSPISPPEGSPADLQLILARLTPGR